MSCGMHLEQIGTVHSPITDFKQEDWGEVAFNSCSSYESEKSRTNRCSHVYLVNVREMKPDVSGMK